jgi:hypothetical protein
MTNPGATSWGAQSPQGPGWYQASDGLWYPPQQPVVQVPVQQYHVEQQQPAQPVQAGGWRPGQVHVAYDGPVEKVPNLKPFYVFFTAIPQFFTLFGLAIMAAFSQYAAFFGVLLMGRVHPRSHDNIVRLYRFQWRMTTYFGCWRNDVPATPPAAAIDAGDDKAKLSIAYGGEGLQRFGPIVKWFTSIPRMITVFFVLIGAYISWIVGLFGVLFKGEFPEASRVKVVDATRQAIELNAYLLLTDNRPW